MGFGASFSKKIMDIDNNQLSDLAVGSYMSGDVVILRRLASVEAEIELTSTLSSIDISSNRKPFTLEVNYLKFKDKF